MRYLPCIFIALIAFGSSVCAEMSQATSSAADAKVYIIEPKDGSKVPSKFKVLFGLVGMGVAPAGTQIENTGHHHLLIDMEELPDLSVPLPATDRLKHFGLGQTETEIELPRGKHTLQLVLGDYLHRPHSPALVSEKIHITVE